MGTDRARAALERAKAQIRKERSARNEPLTDKEVKAMIAKVSKVVVGKGRKAAIFTPKEVKLADLKGRTGNYRAPIVLKGKTLVVGFSQEAFDQIL